MVGRKHLIALHMYLAFYSDQFRYASFHRSHLHTHFKTNMPMTKPLCTLVQMLTNSCSYINTGLQHKSSTFPYTCAGYISTCEPQQDEMNTVHLILQPNESNKFIFTIVSSVCWKLI